MQYDADRNGHPSSAPDEGWNGSAPVADRLDPAEVQRSIHELSSRIHQLEDQARQVSAPFLMESVLRETADMRLQSVRAAEKTYKEAIEAAEEEGRRILDEAEAKAVVILEEARSEGQRQAAELMDQARDEAARIRNSAVEQRTQTRQELERVSADFNAFVKRLLERTAGEHAEAEAAIRDEPTPPAPPISFALPTIQEPDAPAPVAEVEAVVDGEPLADPEPFADAEQHDEPVAALEQQPEAQPVAEAEDVHEAAFAHGYQPHASFSPPTQAAAPDADWGADWADQLKQVAPLPEPVAEDKPAEPTPPPPAPSKDGGFKLPSWLPS